MAGRAGRRGLDSTGRILISCRLYTAGRQKRTGLSRQEIYLLSAQYIQMAGRAGRKGLYSKGRKLLYFLLSLYRWQTGQAEEDLLHRQEIYLLTSCRVYTDADRAGRKGLDSTGRKFIYFLPSINRWQTGQAEKDWTLQVGYLYTSCRVYKDGRQKRTGLYRQEIYILPTKQRFLCSIS